MCFNRWFDLSRFLRNPSELKSIKHISLLRNQMGNQQNQQQQVPSSHQMMNHQHSDYKQMMQQLQTPAATPTAAQQTGPAHQPSQPSAQSHSTSPVSQSQSSFKNLKTELDEEPTDLSRHAHSGVSAELQVSLCRDEYLSVQAEDLSLSHSHIKSEAA